MDKRKDEKKPRKDMTKYADVENTGQFKIYSAITKVKLSFQNSSIVEHHTKVFLQLSWVYT